MINEKKQKLILEHFKNQEEAFWYGSLWNRLSDLDDLSILMFYFYHFESCNENNSRKLLSNYFDNNYHSKQKKIIRESYHVSNYFHLKNYVRLLKEYKYISEDIEELLIYIDNLKIDTQQEEVKIICKNCCGTGDSQSENIWENCSSCYGLGYDLEKLPKLTKESEEALEELSILITPLLVNIKKDLCLQVLEENILNVRDKVMPEYSMLRSIKNF